MDSGHGRVITSLILRDVIPYPCPKLYADLANLCHDIRTLLPEAGIDAMHK